MHDFLRYTVLGLVVGSGYAVAASGLVVTYQTSGIFNFAHGAIGMFMAFVYWKIHVDMGVPWRRLPQLHRELVAAGYVTTELEYPSYTALWRKLASRSE